MTQLCSYTASNGYDVTVYYVTDDQFQVTVVSPSDERSDISVVNNSQEGVDVIANVDDGALTLEATGVVTQQGKFTGSVTATDAAQHTATGTYTNGYPNPDMLGVASIVTAALLSAHGAVFLSDAAAALQEGASQNECPGGMGRMDGALSSQLWFCIASILWAVAMVFAIPAACVTVIGCIPVLLQLAAAIIGITQFCGF